jgi:tetratricopeptide (TPR) repeat protein
MSASFVRSLLPFSLHAMPQVRANLAEIFQQAIALHRRGLLTQAAAHYQNILQCRPEHFDALHMLGVIEYQSGRYEPAMRLIEQAIALQPQQAAPYGNLALVLQALKRPAQALRHLTHALHLSPGNPEILGNRGNVLHDLHRYAEALADYEEVLCVQPDSPKALNNRGNALHSLKRPHEALASYERALALQPDNADVLNNRGNVLRDLRRLEEALASYDRALQLRAHAPEILTNRGDVLQELRQHEAALASYDLALSLKPDGVATWNNRGNALRDLKRYDAALASQERALQLDPDFVEALNNRGNLLRNLNRHTEALASYDRAIALKPGFAEAYSNRGNALRELNRLEEAQHAYRRAVALAPDQVKYYRNLATTRCLTRDDPCYLALERFAQQAEALGPQDRIFMHFALGDALTLLGEHDRAFEHFVQGNALQRARTRYDEASTFVLFEWFETTFTAGLLDSQKGGGDPSATPVFIVGMPRCGSTLIEQVLASHPDVYGAGEYAAFAEVLVEFIERNQAGGARLEITGALTADQFSELGADYERRIRKLGGADQGYRRIIDKALLNFMYLGLIHLALPNAKFIHARRNPVDTCLSCFSKLFDDVPFSFELGELGRYYRAYERLMAHWHAVLPDTVLLEVHYENLVDDFENQVRRMLAHCGLDWDPACLAFYQTERPVATSSLIQIRQPIYRSSVQRWRPAPRLLAPLLEGLAQPQPVPLPPALVPADD